MNVLCQACRPLALHPAAGSLWIKVQWTDMDRRPQVYRVPMVDSGGLEFLPSQAAAAHARASAATAAAAPRRPQGAEYAMVQRAVKAAGVDDEVAAM